MSGLSPYCISERRNPSFLIRRFLSYHGWLIKVWYVGKSLLIIGVSIDWHRPSLINSSKSETPNSNGSTDDSGTEPDSETTERVLSCPSKQTPNKAYFELALADVPADLDFTNSQPVMYRLSIMINSLYGTFLVSFVLEYQVGGWSFFPFFILHKCIECFFGGRLTCLSFTRSLAARKAWFSTWNYTDDSRVINPPTLSY